jgi:protein involved in polysaccharide export with SLBB domain
MSSISKNELYPHEWLVILFLIALFVILTLATHSCESQSLPQDEMTSHYIVNQYIEVSVEGAVENPGKYTIKKGTTVKDLLDIAKLTTSADLRHLKQDRVLRRGQIIKIPEFETIKIILQFENFSLDLELKKGTKLQDLPLLYTFESDIDLRKFQKKRRLKDGEIIRVLTFSHKEGIKQLIVQP